MTKKSPAVSKARKKSKATGQQHAPAPGPVTAPSFKDINGPLITAAKSIELKPRARKCYGLLSYFSQPY